MKRAWAAVLFGLGLFTGLGLMNFLSPLVTVDQGTDPPPLRVVSESEAEALPTPVARPAGALEAQLAELKVANDRLADALYRERQTVEKYRQEKIDQDSAAKEMRDQINRLTRALRKSEETVLDRRSPPENAAVPPNPALTIGLRVNLIQVDDSQQVVAFDLGQADGLRKGSRWQLFVNENRAIEIEITEVRPTFSVARRTESEPLAALELARGRSYVIRPLP